MRSAVAPVAPEMHGPPVMGPGAPLDDEALDDEEDVELDEVLEDEDDEVLEDEDDEVLEDEDDEVLEDDELEDDELEDEDDEVLEDDELVDDEVEVELAPEPLELVDELEDAVIVAPPPPACGPVSPLLPQARRAAPISADSPTIPREFVIESIDP